MTVKGKLHPLGGGKVSPYKKDDILFESSTPGTYDLEASGRIVCLVYCIGGGAGGASGSRLSNAGAASGGSGSGFIGEIVLNGGHIPITVGSAGGFAKNGQAGSGGDTSIGDLLISPAGKGAYAREGSYSIGIGGAFPIINTQIVSTTLNTKGNNGSGGSGSGDAFYYTEAVFEDHGKGGWARKNPSSVTGGSGTPGYVKIIFKKQKG